MLYNIYQEECIEILGKNLNIKGSLEKNGKGGYNALRCPSCGGSDCLSIDPGPNGQPLVICRSTGCRGEDIIKAIRAEGLPFPGPAENCSTTTQIEEAKKERVQREAEMAARHAKIAKVALRIYSEAEALNVPTPYIEAKRLTGNILATLAHSSSARRKGDRLILPLYNDRSEITTIQTIYADGKKILLKDGAKKSSFHPIGIGVEEISNVGASVLCLAEGWATAAALYSSTQVPTIMAVDANNLEPVALALRGLAPEAELIICADDDAEPGKKGNQGIEKAVAAARAVGGKVAYPPRAELEAEGRKLDFWDVWREAGPEAVRRAIEAAKAPEPDAQAAKPDDDAPEASKKSALNREIAKLASISEMDYEQQRKTAAKALNIRTSVLDTLVSQQRQASASEELPFEVTKPWAEPVNPAELFDFIEKIIHRYIFCTPEIGVAATLWAAFTWFINVVQIAPIALITAPDKQCGKTQLLSLLSRLSSRSLSASSISPAALFRAVEEWQPTLFIDEADAFIRGNEELRGIINSGHTRDTASVIRTVGDDHAPKSFATWGAKAIAGIKVERIAPTITDRSIVFPLRRRVKTEKVERLRNADPELFWTLRRKLARFAVDEAEKVASAHVKIPELEELTDRQCDNWEPLLAIAEVAGGVWPEKARTAALALSAPDDEPSGLGQELLGNIKQVFEDCKSNPLASTDRITTSDLLSALCDNEEWRWSSYNKGRAINPRQIASILKSYGIRTNATINLGGDKRAKGYLAADFQDAFARYLPDGAGASAVSTHII